MLRTLMSVLLVKAIPKLVVCWFSMDRKNQVVSGFEVDSLIDQLER